MRQFLWCCCFLLSALVSCLAIVCNFTYQENARNYPEKLINTIASRKKFQLKPKSVSRSGSREFFCDDDSDDGYRDVSSYQVLTKKFNANDEIRFGTQAPKEATAMDDDSREAGETLCDVVTTKIYPKTLPNVLNKLVVVVNHGKFKQEVTIEKCSAANQACKFSSNFPLGYVTRCKQKYLTHTIKVVNEHAQDIVDETVYLPSGCECQVKQKGTTGKA